MPPSPRLRSILIVLAIVSATAFLGPILFRRQLERLIAKHAQKVLDQDTAVLIQTRPRLEKLEQEWRATHPGVNPCGIPPPGIGLVTYAVFEPQADKTFRAGLNMEDQSALTASQAASFIGSDESSVRQLAKDMKDSSVTMIYQHDSELHFLIHDSDTRSFMFVDPRCPQATSYGRMPEHHTSGFAILKPVGGGWYVADEER